MSGVRPFASERPMYGLPAQSLDNQWHFAKSQIDLSSSGVPICNMPRLDLDNQERLVPCSIDLDQGNTSDSSSEADGRLSPISSAPSYLAVAGQRDDVSNCTISGHTLHGMRILQANITSLKYKNIAWLVPDHTYYPFTGDHTQRADFFST